MKTENPKLTQYTSKRPKKQIIMIETEVLREITSHGFTTPLPHFQLLPPRVVELTVRPFLSAVCVIVIDRFKCKALENTNWIPYWLRW